MGKTCLIRFSFILILQRQAGQKPISELIASDYASPAQTAKPVWHTCTDPTGAASITKKAQTVLITTQAMSAGPESKAN